MTLGGVRHGSGRNPSWLWEESVTCGDWLLLLLAISQPDRFLADPRPILAEPWRTPPRAMMDSLKRHDRFFTDQQVLFLDLKNL